MGQQEFDNFKRLIKEWLDSHPNEYAAFVTEMNSLNFSGFFKVFRVATTLVPKYKKAIHKEFRDDRVPNFEELENLLMDSGLAKKLVDGFYNPKKQSIIPAMLAWMYYGRSWECLVEQGEELLKSKNYAGLQKWFFSITIKFIIYKSINSGMRTRKDWQAFRKQQKAIEENNLVEWSLEDEEDIEENKTEDTDSLQRGQSKSAGRKADTRTLPELLIENKDVILKRIGTRLKTHTTETDIARLYIALVEYRLMRTCPIKTFRNALQQQYTDLNIVHERGIQKAYKNLTAPFGSSEKLFKDIGEDHLAIEELKAYLSA